MAAKVGEERYVFETEWYDNQADLIRKYLFTFFPADNTIDMVSHLLSVPLLTLLTV